MSPVAVVHHPKPCGIGEDHSADRNPSAGLRNVGDHVGLDASITCNPGDQPRAAIRTLGWCDDFGRIDLSWLYAPDERENTGESRWAILLAEDVMEEESLPLGLAVS